MIYLLTLALLATPPATGPQKLAAHIIRIQPKARPYAQLLAQRIFVEAKRHGIPVEVMGAVSWIESDYRRGLRGKVGEIGVWQLGAMQGDHQLSAGWATAKRLHPSWPIVLKYGARNWSQFRRTHREEILDDIRAGTLMVAVELRSAAYTCYRMRNIGHRHAGVSWKPSNWYRHRGPDVYAHYNSGIRQPMLGYLRKLRRRSKLIRRLLTSSP